MAGKPRCSTCNGSGRVIWNVYGAPEALKLGEADRSEDECPTCDGLGYELDNFEERNGDARLS